MRDHQDRTARIAGLIDETSVEDLRRTTLQAIDHAHKSAAEIAQVKATHEGALGTIAELRLENERLRQQLHEVKACLEELDRGGRGSSLAGDIKRRMRALRQRLRA